MNVYLIYFQKDAPRTTTLECPGCPSLRALTFDALGLIKVIEAKGSQGGAPGVVERWGELDSSKCVLAASINDRKDDPLLAVARKTGMIEVLSAINGDICFTVSNANEDGPRPEDDAVVGLNLFAGQKLGLTSRFCLYWFVKHMECMQLWQYLMF